MMHIECTNPSVMDFLLRSKLLVLWRNSNGLYELSIILTEACIGCRNCEHVRDQILEYKSYKLVCSSELISSLQIDSCSTCFFFAGELQYLFAWILYSFAWHGGTWRQKAVLSAAAPEHGIGDGEEGGVGQRCEWERVTVRASVGRIVDASLTAATWSLSPLLPRHRLEAGTTCQICVNRVKRLISVICKKEKRLCVWCFL